MSQLCKTFEGFSSLPDNGKKPDTLVWLMHGCGGTGKDFAESLLPDLKKEFRNAAFYAPDGKLASQYSPGYQHFEIEEYYTPDIFAKAPDEWSGTEHKRMDALRTGIEQNSAEINHQIDDLLSLHQLKDSDVVMIGYSQGAQSVLHAAFRRHNPVKAVLGLFGSLIAPNDHARDIRSNPLTLLVGSESDIVLPPRATRLAADVITEAKGRVRTAMVQNADHHKDWSGTFIHTALPALSQMTRAYQ